MKGWDNMNQVDRLIAKAKRLGLGDGDVFVISGETGIWKVGDREFPDFESAEQYIDTLIGDSKGDYTVIIDDLTPELLKETKKQIRESDRKRNKDEKRWFRKEEQKRQKQEAKRRIQKEKHWEKELLRRLDCLEKEQLEQKQLERERLLEIDKNRQLI